MKITKLFTAQELVEGAMLPRWYGISYYDVNRQCYMCHPFPLFIVYGGLRELWWKFWGMFRNTSEAKAYKSGLRDGWERGYTAGKITGRFQLKEELDNLIKQK